MGKMTPGDLDPEQALEALRAAYNDTVALGSPSVNAFANLAWILGETGVGIERRAEMIRRWLHSPELDRWRSPIRASVAGDNTQTTYDFRRTAAAKLRVAAERFVEAAGFAAENKTED